jgi:hypothetical protein
MFTKQSFLLTHDIVYRIDRSRKLVAPNMLLTTAFILALYVPFIGSMWAMMRLLVARYMDIHWFGFVAHLSCSVCLGLWGMVTSLQMLRFPFRVANSNSAVRDAWLVSECIIETLMRHLALLRNQPSPFENELHRLQKACARQHRIWKIRMARRDFHFALKRKRISYDDCQRLLLTFANNDAKINANDAPSGNIVPEGTLPGSMEDTEKFLNLEIYHEVDATSEEKFLTIDDCFQEVADAVDSYLQFSPGDRIYVEADEEAAIHAGAYDSNHLALTCSKARTGSVEKTFPGYVMVRFDDERPPAVAVRASLCQLLQDRCSSSNILELAQDPATISDDSSGRATENDSVYSPGDRVFVETDQEAAGHVDASDVSEATAILSKTRTGSVVQSLAGYVMVLFDGESSPVAVLASLCQPLQEHFPSLDFTRLGQGPPTSARVDSSADCSDSHKATPEDVKDPSLEEQSYSKRKYRTVEEALVEGGWQIVRAKKHICYRRVAKSGDGRKQEQHFVMSKTSSDCRSGLAALATLHRLDEDYRPMERCNENRVGWRMCSLCQQEKADDCFSKTQLQKTSNYKCRECIAVLL